MRFYIRIIEYKEISITFLVIILFIYSNLKTGRIISLSTPINAWLTYNQVSMMNGDPNHDGYVSRISNTVTRISSGRTNYALMAIYAR